jgi:hypothetical protein
MALQIIINTIIGVNMDAQAIIIIITKDLTCLDRLTPMRRHGGPEDADDESWGRWMKSKSSDEHTGVK